MDGWFLVAETGKKIVRTRNRTLRDEPLAVQYALSNWTDLQPVSGSVRKIGIPHNIPVSARRLLRAPVTLSDDETDRDEQPAPTQPQVTAADDPVTFAATAVSGRERQRVSTEAAERFLASLAI